MPLHGEMSCWTKSRAGKRTVPICQEPPGGLPATEELGGRCLFKAELNWWGGGSRRLPQEDLRGTSPNLVSAAGKWE